MCQDPVFQKSDLFETIFRRLFRVGSRLTNLLPNCVTGNFGSQDFLPKVNFLAILKKIDHKRTVLVTFVDGLTTGIFNGAFVKLGGSMGLCFLGEIQLHDDQHSWMMGFMINCQSIWNAVCLRRLCRSPATFFRLR